MKRDSSKSKNRRRTEGFPLPVLLAMAAVTLFIMILCFCLGSVTIPLAETLRILGAALKDLVSGLFPTAAAGASAGTAGRVLDGAALNHLSADGLASATHISILLKIRLPRVLCTALTGACLSLCGAAMQGLLKNPLADGSTLGVSSGAALGAAVSIAFGIRLPFLPFSAAMGMAIVFAFISLILILSLAMRLDNSLSTNTIILIGIIFSMFVSSLLTLLLTFAADKVKNITFWTMGSLSGSSYENAALLLAVLLVGGGILLRLARELNAFAIGEDNARSIGVNVRAVRLTVLITVSAMIGVCVSIGGSIGFVGLVTPHMVRFITGPNHRKLLPASLFAGASFLMLADLVARMLLRPLELPVGVVTSIVGAVMFVWIYYKNAANHR